MKKMFLGLFSFTLAAGSALQAFAADPPCTAAGLNGKQPVFAGGSTALLPFLRAVGPKISQNTNYVVVSNVPKFSSCDGVGGITKGTVIPKSTTLSYFPTDLSSDVTQEATGRKCVTEADVSLDLGLSDVFVESCTGTARPADISDIKGPAQAMLFVVPAASTQQAITAEEAYMVFGFNGDSKYPQVAPWTEPTAIQIRPDTSGTRRVLAATVGIPNQKFIGNVQAGSGDVFKAVSGGSEATIGILGADYLDAGSDRRKAVKALAFRGFNQKFAFYADSTPESRDKLNVRQGRYLGLGYAHLIGKLDNGKIANAGVQALVDAITGQDDDAVKAVAAANLIPLCAMKVERREEGGDLYPFTPAKDCTAVYESVAK